MVWRNSGTRFFFFKISIELWNLKKQSRTSRWAHKMVNLFNISSKSDSFRDPHTWDQANSSYKSSDFLIHKFLRLKKIAFYCF